MNTPDSVRLTPPFWRHDAYTLRRLADAISVSAGDLSPASTNSASALRIVDLGAGSSPYRSIFERRGAHYVPCDIDAPDDGEHVRIVQGEPVPLPDASADAVVSFQVLEHVWDIDWYLAEARRLLHDDGTLLLSTHGTWLYHPHPTDYRRWTRDGLMLEIESRGFHVKSIVPLLGPLAWTTQFRALGYHAVLSKIPVVGGAASALVCAGMYLRMRVEDAITPAELISSNAAIYLITATKIMLPPRD